MAERIELDSGDRAPAPSVAAGPLWGRRMLTLLIAVAAIGGFAMVVVYSYDQGDEAGTGQNAPVITAQNGPTKVRPDTPGGMSVPNQDKQVYGQLDTARRPDVVERLLPPPETVAAKPPPEPLMAGGNNALSAIESEQASIARQLSALAPAAGSSGASLPPAPSVEPAQVAAVPPAPMSQPVEPKATPEKKVAPAKKKTAATSSRATKASSPYRVQIASLRSAGAAQNAWNSISKSHKDLFGKLEPKIVKIDLAGKGTFYRVQAGPLDGPSEARSFCSTLKKRKIGCLVVRP